MDWWHVYLWAAGALLAFASLEPGDPPSAWAQVLLWPLVAPLAALWALLPDNRPRI